MSVEAILTQLTLEIAKLTAARDAILKSQTTIKSPKVTKVTKASKGAKASKAKSAAKASKTAKPKAKGRVYSAEEREAASKRMKAAWAKRKKAAKGL